MALPTELLVPTQWVDTTIESQGKTFVFGIRHNWFEQSKLQTECSYIDAAGKARLNLAQYELELLLRFVSYEGKPLTREDAMNLWADIKEKLTSAIIKGRDVEVAKSDPK